MTLFIEDGAPVIVQGMTGHQGMTHTARMNGLGEGGGTVVTVYLPLKKQAEAAL